MNDVIDEFSGADGTNLVDTSNSASTQSSGTPTVNITPGVANAMIWAIANDSVTAVGNIGGSTAAKGGDDLQQDWSEYRLLSGGSGSAISAAFTGSGAYTIFAVSVKPPAATGIVSKSLLVNQALNRAATWFADLFDVEWTINPIITRRRDYMRALVKSLPARGARRWLEIICGREVLEAILAEAESLELVTEYEYDLCHA